jgi:NAD(P)H-hydrate epimerase
MITQDEVKVLDANSQALGVPNHTLMENAGRGVAEAMKRNFELKGKTILILIGSGNNGGDGLVAARYLRKVCKVKIYLVKDPKTDLSKKNLKKVRSLIMTKLRDANKLKPHIRSADVVVDALLGVGITGEVRPPYRKIITMVNKTKAWVVSIDIPSGFGSRKAVLPDLTVTFHDRKEGMNKENCGKIVVTDIGIPPEAQTYTGPGEPLLIPRPDSSTHKGQRGVVLVIGGGPYYGAPALAAQAAQRCGIDLAYLAVPESVADRVAAHSMNFILRPLEGDHVTVDHLQEIQRDFRRSNAIILGPGIGKSSDDAVLEVIKESPIPVIVDADALKALDGHEKELRGKTLVLTPHGGEFRHLTTERPRADVENRSDQVKYWARRYRSTILLKGPVDIISDGNNVKRNLTGNEAMSTGGTGDVLAGLVGAFLAKGMRPFDAARVGAYVNGKAGDLARAKLGHSMTATDVLEAVPEVMLTHVPWWGKK